MSDQDFFFDEDEKPVQKQASSGASSSSKQPARGGPSKTAPSKGAAAFPSPGGFELTWTITALIGVVALLFGVIVGYAIPKDSVNVTPGSPAMQTAPQLTPEQIQGGLPEGHPDVGAMTGSGTATGSATTTGN